MGGNGPLAGPPHWVVRVAANDISHVAEAIRQRLGVGKRPAALEPKSSRPKGLDLDPLLVIGLLRGFERTAHLMQPASALGTGGRWAGSDRVPVARLKAIRVDLWGAPMVDRLQSFVAGAMGVKRSPFGLVVWTMPLRLAELTVGPFVPIAEAMPAMVWLGDPDGRPCPTRQGCWTWCDTRRMAAGPRARPREGRGLGQAAN